MNTIMSRHRPAGQHGSSSNLPSAPLDGSFKRFIKIILESSIALKMLELPLKFVREYGDELSEFVKLRVTDNQVWQVELTKGKSNFWLDGGWDEFVRYYSIHHGCLVLFEYKGMCKGMSNFKVFIFDKSACETLYPTIATSFGDDPETFRSGGSRTKKRKYILPDSDLESGHEFFNNNDTHKSLSNIITNNKFSSVLKKASFKTKRAVDEANNLNLKNDAFMVILLLHQIRDKHLDVPARFVNKRLHNPPAILKLQVSSGRVWSVVLRRVSDRWRLSEGWADFCSDNFLKEGDVCTFELIPSVGTALLEVSIFRAS